MGYNKSKFANVGNPNSSYTTLNSQTGGGTQASGGGNKKNKKFGGQGNRLGGEAGNTGSQRLSPDEIRQKQLAAAEARVDSNAQRGISGAKAKVCSRSTFHLVSDREVGLLEKFFPGEKAVLGGGICPGHLGSEDAQKSKRSKQTKFMHQHAPRRTRSSLRNSGRTNSLAASRRGTKRKRKIRP